MARAHLDILYRGPLASCNYACPYCPFAKRRDSRETLRRDADQLARFVDWAGGQTRRTLGILFTPWGEALIRPAYRAAMASGDYDSAAEVQAEMATIARRLGAEQRGGRHGGPVVRPVGISSMQGQHGGGAWHRPNRSAGMNAGKIADEPIAEHVACQSARRRVMLEHADSGFRRFQTS